jgi:hypothetical protein
MARAALRPELVSAFFVQELPDLARTRLIFKRPRITIQTFPTSTSSLLPRKRPVPTRSSGIDFGDRVGIVLPQPSGASALKRSTSDATTRRESRQEAGAAGLLGLVHDPRAVER